MRRRSKKNTLLWRIFAISILVHVVALPVLAHFGAFKKIEQHFLDTRLITLPPPPREAKQEPKEQKKVARRIAPVAHKAAVPSHQGREAAHRAPVNIPKVVASAAGPGGGAGEPSIAANGSGKVGEIPQAATGNGTPGGNNAPALAPAPSPKAEVATKPAQAPEPATRTTPAPVPPPAPRAEQPVVAKAPTFTEVVPTYSPQPSIPDDLRGVDLDRTFVAEFTVGPDGVPTAVRVAQSTGVDELDRIALDASRQWKFKPATRDGQPVESVVRLHIQFQVSG